MPDTPPVDLDLAPRREELTRLGFSIVQEHDDTFTAVRSGRAKDLANIQWTTIVRVRRVEHIDAATIRADQAALREDAPPLDPPARAPLGRMNMRAELLCYLADTADDDARVIAQAPPPYDFKAHRQTGILEASGQRFHLTSSGMVLWATRPKVNWLISRVLDPASADPGEPRSGLTTYFWASIAAVVLSTLAGFALIALLVLFLIAMLAVLVVLGVGVGIFLGTAG